LLNSDGKIVGKEDILILDKPEMVLEFSNMAEMPTPSLFRGFSAPVNHISMHGSEELLVLMKDDTDIYNKCEAAKQLITNIIAAYCDGKPVKLELDHLLAYIVLLHNPDNPKLRTWITAELLALPSEEALIASLPKANFEKIAAGRRLVQKQLAHELKDALTKQVEILNSKSPSGINALFDMNAAGIRRLKAVCYSYLQVIDPKGTEEALLKQFEGALGKNMTETISALTLLADANYAQLDKLLAAFYQHWRI